jgi:integrase
MAKANLTEGFAERVQAAASRIDYWDETLAGFGLRVSDTGVKSWCVLYRFNGVQKRFTIGSYPAVTAAQARKAAKEALGNAQLGKADAAAEKVATRGAGTFGEAAEQYLAHIKDKPSCRDFRGMVERELPSWTNRPLASITKRDLRAVLEAIESKGHARMHNRVRGLVSAIFNFANKRSDDLVPNPATSYEKLKGTSRDRVLTDDEIRRLWRALDSESPRCAAFVRLCLLTGQRAREVLKMSKAELDFENAVWNLAGDRTKNEQPHAVPLTRAMLDVIDTVKNGTPYLFPMSRNPALPLNQFRGWIDPLREELSFEKDWTCHDLRRTCRTGLARLGVGRDVGERILNHAQGSGVAATYDRYDYLEQKRTALQKWNDRLAEIVS